MQKLTEAEKKYLRGAIYYYLYEATHDQPDGGASPILPDGKEKTKIVSACKKIGIDFT